ASGRALRTLAGHTDRVRGLALSGDGRTAVTGSHDRSVKVWDTASGRCLHTLWGHAREVESVALSPDGRLALSGSHDGPVIVSDTAGGVPRHKFPGHHKSWGEGFAFTPDGRLVARARSGEALRSSA